MKLKYSCLLILCLLVSLSCKKLDTKPQDFLPPEAYYNTEEKLNASLTGVYDALGSTGLYGSRMCYLLGLEADEGYYARSTTPIGPHEYNFTASHANINMYWTTLYTGITRANALLANVDNNPEIKAGIRSQIRGEALFLRGYYYFMLVQSFGGVPLVLKPTLDVDDVDIPRATDKEVYDQILKDMKEAEGLVAKINLLGYSGRVSKSAVRGILARVCLFMAGYPLKDISKYAEAREWAKKVIDDTEAAHDLNPSYSSIFIKYARDEYDIKESIWEVEFWGNNGESYTEAGGVGYLNGPASANTDTGEGFGGVRATASLYQLYKAGDLRRDWSIAGFTYNATGATGAKTAITTVSVATLYNRTSGKYRREYELVLPKSRSVTPINFPLLRYSDVLLMFAEADNEINATPSTEAVDAVNKVRQRAWSTGIKAITVTNGGANYTSAPTVTISVPAAGGVRAMATAVISTSTKKVTSIPLVFDGVTGTQMGSNYTSATITISGGGGTGATATATVHKLTDANVPAADMASQEDFRQFIQDERARELCFETLRKGDLIRWGIFVFTMNKIGDQVTQQVPTAYWAQRYHNVKEKHLLWPIPTSELAVNNALKQNPYW
ncbi:RagB/SusD family nutrient uptake outer membrane protein [Pedobacter nyackensis]|uniref:Starch-binding associating with outer membrane n=1 Tax=Pedobacter nyackensis TaxID=475255 RepID=A0A1W2EX37_9SPHI|nr:RagB/SusD family nutrient uptake outer membrane protein [Pedobacter nyackensis]SMD14279.1 Starch-binding associating with outer membrane [Pedobacter nyackensis]